MSREPGPPDRGRDETILSRASWIPRLSEGERTWPLSIPEEAKTGAPPEATKRNSGISYRLHYTLSRLEGEAIPP